MRTAPPVSLRHGLGLILTALAALGGAGCDGGGSGSRGEGDVAIAFTDAPQSDISVFEAEVVAVKLRRSDGLEVSALPTRRRIDFADLVSVAELVTAARIPDGTYTDLTLTLDLVDRVGLVSATNGAVARLASATQNADAAILDTNGQEFTGPVDLEVKLDPQSPLVIAPGTPRVLTIDFDLDGSTLADAAQNQIRVLPILKADVDVRRRPTPFRIRGPLVSADTRSQSFVLALRPHPLATPFGSVTIHTRPGTFYEVEGVTATGTTGFALLENTKTATAVVAHAVFEPATRRFVALAVEAGSSVPGGALDVVAGIVTAKGAGTLQVFGHTIERQTGAVAYHRTVTVTAGPSTRIVRRLTGNLTLADIAVGQNVIAAGDLAGGSLGTVASPTAAIRMVPVAICGTITSPSPLTIDVVKIGPFAASRFANLQTGGAGWKVVGATTTATTGADLLITGFILTTTTAQVFADSIADITHFGYALARWAPPAAANPVIAATGGNITFNIAAAALTLTAEGCDPAGPINFGLLHVSPSGSPQGFFVLHEAPGRTRLFTDFMSWRDALSVSLTTKKLRQVVAVGDPTPGITSLDVDADQVTAITE